MAIPSRLSQETYNYNGTKISVVASDPIRQTVTYNVDGKKITVLSYYTVYDVVNELSKSQKENNYYDQTIAQYEAYITKYENDLVEYKAIQNNCQETIVENNQTINKIKRKSETNYKNEKKHNNKINRNGKDNFENYASVQDRRAVQNAEDNISKANKEDSLASMGEGSCYFAIFDYVLKKGKCEIERIAFGC